MADEVTAETSAGEALSAFLRSPPGRYALAWEQQHLAACVADIFGYHALQLGLPEIDALRENRMPLRFCASDRLLDARLYNGDGQHTRVAVINRYEELPFASASIDLVVMPHILEFAHEPHQVLREVDRVLRPEGRVIVSGMNPLSLWGARQAIPRAVVQPFLPGEGRFIGQPRLRDWLKLLGFELDRGRYGCYRPPCRSQKWLERTAFMERAGDRWWPICGAVYFVSAIKRVRGMRLVGPAWKVAPARAVVGVASPQFAPPAGAPRRGARRVVHPDEALSDTCSREKAEAG